MEFSNFCLQTVFLDRAARLNYSDAIFFRTGKTSAVRCAVHVHDDSVAQRHARAGERASLEPSPRRTLLPPARGAGSSLSTRACWPVL